jgi:hypothetical protein
MKRIYFILQPILVFIIIGCNSHKDTLLYKNCIETCKNNDGLICRSLGDSLPEICERNAKECIKNYGSVEGCNKIYTFDQKEKEEKKKAFDERVEKYRKNTQDAIDEFHCKSNCSSDRKICIENNGKQCSMKCIKNCDAIRDACRDKCKQ